MALSEGDFATAEMIFEKHLQQQNNSVEALRGLARVALHRGDIDRAERLTQRALSIDKTADVQLLMGEILGKQGKRREAERYLKHAMEYHSSDPYGRALLAEQMIRQGRWEDGTNEYIDAVSDDPHGDAFRQLQRVLIDLVDAFVAGRLPENEAMKFVNRLDYSVPKSGPEMQSFFAEVRRALTSRQRLARNDRAAEHTSLPSQVRKAASNASGSGGTQRPQRSGPPGGGQPSAPPRSSQPPQRQQRAQRASSQPSPSPEQQTSAADRSSDGTPGGVEANQKDLAAVIQHERSLNRDLLSGIADMSPPKWPSKAGYDSIDTVRPVLENPGSVLDGAAGIDTRDFRLTSGDLLTEIFLERCLRNLIVASQKGKPTSLVMRPESIPQMELNCRDGLLSEVRPLSTLYEDRPGFEDYRQLALGMFLGECLVQTYDGTWTFQTPPKDSYLEIGTVILQPFEVASRWVNAQDKDDVRLEVLARQAREASQKSTSLTIVQDYIDPTRELEGAALASKLAELWASYLFALSDSTFSDVDERIEPVEVGPDAILFKLGAEWAPEFAQGPQQASRLDDDTVGMIYLRGNGEFAPLASRKSLERYLEATADELDQETGAQVIDLIDRYHRPQWYVARSSEQAQALRKRFSSQRIDAPEAELSGGTASLVVWGAGADGERRWTITYDANALSVWTVEVERF